MNATAPVTELAIIDDNKPTTPTTPTTRALMASVTPVQLLQHAMDSGADLDRLERLMALQQQWESDQARKAYNVAFAEFRAKAVKVIRQREVAQGPLKGNRYAELSTLVEAVTPALSECGLSASWKLTKDEKDWMEVTCTLKHALGFSESVSMGGAPDVGPGRNAIQARASTVSYLERYTLKAITGLSEGGDDEIGRASCRERVSSPV